MTDLPEELQAELVEFVRIVASGHWPVGYQRIHRDAAAIVAKLPPPVDPDIEEARKLVRIWFDGDNDRLRKSEAILFAKHGIERGRELERASQ